MDEKLGKFIDDFADLVQLAQAGRQQRQAGPQLLDALIATHRESLRAHGQHLKRGVLLYGPPGTGKTHTVRYLLGQSTGCGRLCSS